MEQYIPKSAVENILRNLWKEDDGHNAEHRICYNKALQEVQCEIDTLEVKEAQEEPISKNYRERYKRIAQSEKFKKTYEGMSVGEIMHVEGEEPVSEDLEEASKEWLRPQLDKSYANYGETKMMELTHFDGYAMLDAIEFGTKWQKQQMMAKTIDAEVKVDAGGYPYIPQMELYDYDKDIPLAKEGDKYMVVLIKEN